MKEGETEESSSSSESEGEVEPEVSNLDARPYQVELLERARERNTIVCLGTGTGKTFISVMLIKEMAHQVRETFKNGGKRTFFVVDTGLRVCHMYWLGVWRGACVGCGFRCNEHIFH